MSREDESKDFQIAHLEHPEAGHQKFEHEHVTDSLAADYIDPTVTISPEEDRRLRRKAYK